MKEKLVTISAKDEKKPQVTSSGRIIHNQKCKYASYVYSSFLQTFLSTETIETFITQKTEDWDFNNHISSVQRHLFIHILPFLKSRCVLQFLFSHHWTKYGLTIHGILNLMTHSISFFAYTNGSILPSDYWNYKSYLWESWNICFRF